MGGEEAELVPYFIARESAISNAFNAARNSKVPRFLRFLIVRFRIAIYEIVFFIDDALIIADGKCVCIR